MQKIPNNRVKAACALNERVASLIDDGYRVRFKSSSFNNEMWWVTLLHKNGHKITLCAYWRKNKLIQKTDGRITHESSLY